MDPIMWDPFRYKVGGKLLNGQFEEFIDRYGSTDFGQYNATRDIAAYAILKEVEAGRGTPHGGAYLDFRHIAEKDLRAAFGPVIDRLLANGIDLSRMPVEVGPMAHYHMGGIRVDANMRTRIEGLYAAGEAVGGSNGANRLSGNAITEAFVFGERAGCAAADDVKAANSNWDEKLAEESIARLERFGRTSDDNGIAPIVLQTELQKIMWDLAGPFRTGDKLTRAQARIAEIKTTELRHLHLGNEREFNLDVQDGFELRAMMTAAEAVVYAALGRAESRGAHQREDFPLADYQLIKNQVLELRDGELVCRWAQPVRLDRSQLEKPLMP
jgi:succinate dehydrogenase/fumarate reductase flavoprotein subunit